MSQITYRIDKIQLNEEAWVNPTLTIQYRLQSSADVGANYTTVADSVPIETDGTINPAVKITSLTEGETYVLKYILNNNQSEYQQTNITVPVSYNTGAAIDKELNAMPNFQYTIYETGLRDSYMPEKIGLLHELRNSRSDSFENFGNIIVEVENENVDGGGYIKRDSELGLQLNNNVTAVYLNPTEDIGNNELSLLGADGTNQYSIGLHVFLTTEDFAQTNTDGKLWLWYSGTPTNHVGSYINNSTKYVHWVHKAGSTTEEVILDHAIEVNKWARIFYRRDGGNPSDSFLNQILMRIDSGYYSPSTPTYFTSATNYTPSVDNPIYFGCGRQQSTGDILITQCTMKYIYYRQTVVDNSPRDMLMFPYYPRVLCQDSTGGDEYIIPFYYFVVCDNGSCTFVLPHDIPVGERRLIVKTYSSERPAKYLTIHPFVKRETSIDIDFLTDTDAREKVSENFYALHKAWGGINGGVVAENIYMKGNNLILEAHGDIYTDSVQGVNRDGTPKFDTIESSPGWGSNPYYGLPWVRRTGACLVSKDYCGFGRYLVRCKIPLQKGAASAWWSFHYEEVYPETPDWEVILGEGLRKQAGYVVRNHEIDIEQGSHLIMGEFNGWIEVQNNVLFFDVFEGQHIGIKNDTVSSSNNGLWKLVNTSAPTLQSSWTKVSDTYNLVDSPDYTNSKFNNWVGELGSGNGNRYKDDAPDTYNPDEYYAMLTDLDMNTSDGNFHDFEYRWYADRVEFYIDGILKQTNTAFVPDIPGRWTFGLWLPSGGDSSGLIVPPWQYKPSSAWGGHPADWVAVQMEVEKILFEPYSDEVAGGNNRLIGETYGYDGMRELEL